MDTRRLLYRVALPAFLLNGLVAPPAAATQDEKSISPSTCQARGPGTTDSELTIGPYGITNPGSTNETVICPIPGDSDIGWSSSPGSSAYMYVYYRIGSVSGSVSCTAFTSTAAVVDAASYSVSHSSTTLAPGTRSSLYFDLAESSGVYNVAPPASVVCTLSPKAALGWIYFLETQPTNTP